MRRLGHRGLLTLLPLLLVYPLGCATTTRGADPGANGPEPIRLEKGMIPPKRIADQCPPPDYPRALRKAEITGRVVLLVGVKEDGTVGPVRVRSGHEALADLAVRAVKQCRFTPAIFEGAPVSVWLPVPYVFLLEPKATSSECEPCTESPFGFP